MGFFKNRLSFSPPDAAHPQKQETPTSTDDLKNLAKGIFKKLF